jgi:hypothetical protein
MTIGIETGNGKVIRYEIDEEVINGLYQTLDFKKVGDNCKNFDIEIDTPKDGVIASKLSKRENLCIITMKIDEENQVQYLVGNNMSLIELNRIPSNKMSSELRDIITQGYELTKKTF